LTTEEVKEKKASGYNPWDYYNTNPELKLVVDRLYSGFFSHGDPNLFKPLLDSLLYQDDYLLFADFQSYVECQDRISEVYRDQDHWTRMSILNMARMGKFSSDRSIEDYLQYVWKALPVQIEVPEYSQVNGDLKLTF
jgi:starch phosphorylase